MPVHPRAKAILDLFDFGLEQLSDLPVADLRAVTDDMAEQTPRARHRRHA